VKNVLTFDVDCGRTILLFLCFAFTWTNAIQGPVSVDGCCCSVPSLPLAGHIYPWKRLIPQTTCLCHSLIRRDPLYLIPKDEVSTIFIELLHSLKMMRAWCNAYQLHLFTSRVCNDDLINV
jgi:hypothetical protein